MRKWKEYDIKNGKKTKVNQYRKTFQTHYKNGMKDGVEKEWYKSGRKKFLKHFKNGVENGVRKEWDEEGWLSIFYCREKASQYIYQEVM